MHVARQGSCFYVELAPELGALSCLCVVCVCVCPKHAALHSGVHVLGWFHQVLHLKSQLASQPRG